MSPIKGEQAFDAFFESIYGDQWHLLKQKLLEPGAKYARQNRFCTENLSLDMIGNESEEVPFAFEMKQDFDFTKLEQNPLPYYRMDPASIVAAQALSINPGMRVLDMCAAPGGKSLILAENLFLEDEQLNLEGELILNELSARRRFRLMTVVKRYLPKEARS